MTVLVTPTGQPPAWVHAVPRSIGWATVVIGTAVLLGWSADVTVLSAIDPSLPAMKPLSAVAVIGAGATFLVARTRRPALWWTTVVVPFLIGAGVLVEWVTGADLRIDQLLFDDDTESRYPGRPAPQFSIAVLLFSLERALSGVGRGWARQVDKIAVAGFCLIVLAVETGYAFGAEELTSTSEVIGMSAPSAVALALLAVGVLASHADRRPLRYLWDAGATGQLTRRLLPTVVLAPPLLGILALTGEQAGWYQHELAVALITGAMVATLAGVVSVTAETVRATADDLRASEERSRHLADHDPLTGLLNRRSFEAALEAQLAEVRQGSRTGGLLAIDVDHFKEVNDTLGHHAGDAVLVALGARIQEHLREGDALARLGGDELAVLVRAGDEAGCAAVAERIRLVAREAGRSLAVSPEDPRHRVSVSVGLVPFAAVDAGDLTAAKVLVYADLALYGAKGAGRDQVSGPPPGTVADLPPLEQE
ncbi:GGDEF domain-containing protein [Nocardioides stalactiti]|uniref:GGDEF domain-containing protein n=1 Tax=Nocardioides stalactiti TaxID=2755356 RepID=UPI0015FF1084|nr:GGDEF domain-containing protein [Nocardioides stalactiti]